jgi:hypothetical protein
MKLKQILGSPQSKNKPAPTLSVGYCNGRLYINAPSVELLSLKEGDQLAFFQDTDNPQDWYFSKSDLNGSLTLKLVKSALVTFNAGVARGLLKSLDIHDSTVFFISSSPVTIGEQRYWKILTDKIVH